jgi:hypothetical protein
MQVATDPSGGYWVTPDTGGRIVKKVYESTPVRQLANVVSIGTDALEGPIDNGEVGAAWVGESQTRAQTDAAQLGMWRIPVNELYAYPMVTQKLLEDAKIDVEGVARRQVVGQILPQGECGVHQRHRHPPAQGHPAISVRDHGRRHPRLGHVRGGQVGRQRGVPRGSLGAGGSADRPDLRGEGRLSPARRLPDGAQDDGRGPQAQGRAGQLPGRPAAARQRPGRDDLRLPQRRRRGHAGAGDNNSLSILFGDFNEGYTIVDRLGISVVRDNITQPGFVKYHMRKRVGGGAVNFEALKAMKFAA